MLGIQEIGCYIPQDRVSNYDKMERFRITAEFIEKKIGVKSLSVKKQTEETSDLCVRAFEALQAKTRIETEEIGAMIVVTQNPDSNIPHTSAIVHGLLNLPEFCACFDVSLGCSGFVYGVSILKSFMLDNGISKGVLITADPYSKIVDPYDKNTALLFGDAAAATLITENPVYTLGKSTYGTSGKNFSELKLNENGKLFMNGRGIVNFAVKRLPSDILRMLTLNGLTLSDIDRFVFHQGSKYIVETLQNKMEIPGEKVVYDIYDYGNTISSSIPILLEKEMKNKQNKHLLICGFGVGLSWSSAVLNRVIGQ